ncbi:epoxide hydrolase family protein [Roseomonas chloroacetimidivorans]|uniref:epoxide hydrolase family protein n=1 Tax=Roseomonas chloroacetimidivorans TaxID=1766656 RepID=UPI003C7396FC
MMETTPFKIRWTGAALDRLRERLGAFTFPRAPEGEDGWRYGCDPDFLSALRDHWVEGFDAEAAAAELNRYPQIMARVENIDIHAVHVVGEAGGRRPLLLTHGWPGSVYEFWQVIGPLAFPSRYGGTAEDAFDLVIPSLPGFGFSGKPRSPIGPRTTARLFDALMRGLGYGRYRAQGGDWGAGVSAWLALDYPGSVKAIHLNYLLTQPDAEPGTPEEKAWKAAFDANQQKLGAYAQLQGTKPQSLAYAMQANPLAQAAWIVERFHDWSDHRDRPFQAIFSRDQLLTNIMIYVMNDAFTTAAWYYAGAQAENVRKIPPGRRVQVPTAIAAYPDPRSPFPPRSWVERGYAVNRWIDQPKGGHFAAMEVPTAFIADIREWGRETDA